MLKHADGKIHCAGSQMATSSKFLGQQWTLSPRRYQLLPCTELTISNGSTCP